MKQLPVFGTIADAYRFVWENRQDFLLIAFLPVVIGAVAQTLLLGFLSPDVPVEPPPDAEAQGTSGPGVAVLLNLLVSIVLYVMFSVAWHRMFLAQEQTTVGAALRWGPRQMRFLARFALLVLLTAAVGLAFGGLATLGAVATAGAGPSPLQALAFMGAIVVVSLVAARLFLILPAAALDEQMTLQESWRLTQGNSWRMVGISFLPPDSDLDRVDHSVGATAGCRWRTFARRIVDRYTGGRTSRAVLPVCQRRRNG